MHAALSLGVGALTTPRALPRRAAGPVGPAPRAAPAARTASRRSVAAAAEEKTAPPKADTGPGKLITATEIPAFIPRTDLIEQLYRWVVIEADDAKVREDVGERERSGGGGGGGAGPEPPPAPSHTRPLLLLSLSIQAKYGAPLRVIPFTTAEGIPWGFNVEILRDGAPTATLSIGFDLTDAQRHEWVGRGEDGFPVLQGKVAQVSGKFFEIR